MTIVDLRNLPAAVADQLTDANEGLVDALLNLTWERVSGAGPEGEIVYGVKPSVRFASGFLMPRFEESGVEDETSDIHISTHGLDCQIATKASGHLVVKPEFSIYVRALPSWDELTRPELDLFPNPQLQHTVEQFVRDEKVRRLAIAKASEAAKPAEERRPYRELEQEIYRQVLAEQGVRISDDGLLADAEPPPADDATGQEAEQDPAAAGPDGVPARLLVQSGRYIFDNDQAALELDIPQKWRRLRVNMEPLAVDLSDDGSMQASAAAWTQALQNALSGVVRDWLATDEGRDWAYRLATIRPSYFRNEAAWNAFLGELRKNAPAISDIAPNLSGVTLTLLRNPDLRDSSRQNLRIIFENNSSEVRKRRRERFDHGLFQVRMSVSLPAASHRPLRLDRVEPSYRFRNFLLYPAIGINCGVTESRSGEELKLVTTWMPRYHQPRIVPNEVPNVPTRFADLAVDFDPARLRPLVTAYSAWIDSEEAQVDPAFGVQDMTEADRERERFKEDIGSYRREVQRIALGIDLLEASYGKFREKPSNRHAIPYRAWRFLNETFQWAGAERKIEGWRLFQLAFILAHLPTIASRLPEYAQNPWFDPEFDEETATLLYFPTGGGKSEAFFGLLLFTLFFDRLRGKNIGVSALVRYPLRLLTLQQSQRLLNLLMRAELLRRTNGITGAPFEIGFWVGSGNTPNKNDDPRLAPVPKLGDPKHPDDENLTAAYREVNSSFNKIPHCPLCSQPTGLRRIPCGASDEIGIICFNPECRWNADTAKSRLPFLIVDRDIYARAPAVLLGVIDKLALVGQHPSTINRVMGMFGLARWQEDATNRLVMPTRQALKEGAAANGCVPLAPAYENGREVFCDPFPALIIQDETHLLEESLGTFAGLFETILEQLFVRAAELLGDRVARSPYGSGAPRLPKVIAATATVSVPQQQFGALYQRRHMHFPYPGTSIYRSFYAIPAQPAVAARRGLAGDDVRAPEIEAPWMRVYTCIMTNGRNHTVTTVSVLAAYHLAVTELWQDLLSDAIRAAAVDRIVRALSPDSVLTPFHVQAIRSCATHDSGIIPTLLDLMRISLTYVTNKKGGDQVIDAFREEVIKLHRRHARALHQLHIRLISGGVDVADIQEIMREAEGGQRPGDPFPDLEQSLRNIVATSAISHGVDVDKFNAMFFAGMPTDVAEFIQASSRVGRAHVGFSMLIPTPHARRDRYIVETHDIFHRFLERMIAPPAITRWATSAHDRALASLFQAWLCGWAEQKLFKETATLTKDRAPTFETVNDVRQLLTGSALPGAAKDFMEFAVGAVGVRGRGVQRLGGAPHPEFYDARIRNLAKNITDQFRDLYMTTRLGDYWQGALVGAPPMMSLRDIDEGGRFFAARAFGSPPLKREVEQELLRNALRVVRRQTGRVSEFDSEEGEV